MPAIHVISFGETMLRLSPPPQQRLADAKQYNVYVAGTESNTLACLARLGARATWISALPANPMGRLVESTLRSHGVDTSLVVWRPESERVGTFYGEESAPPLGPLVYYDRANSACALMDPDIDLTGLEMASLLHLTGITPALGSNVTALFTYLLDFSRRHNIPLSFDVNYRAKLWGAAEAAEKLEQVCTQANILFCTIADAAVLWGLEGDAESVLAGLAARFGSQGKTIVLTLGGEGAAELRDGRYSRAPAFPTEGSYRFGSGDAFAAGYLYAYLDRESYTRSKELQAPTPLMFGNALAALKRCIAGDIASVTVQEVVALLSSKGCGRFR